MPNFVLERARVLPSLTKRFLVNSLYLQFTRLPGQAVGTTQQQTSISITMLHCTMLPAQVVYSQFNFRSAFTNLSTSKSFRSLLPSHSQPLSVCSLLFQRSSNLSSPYASLLLCPRRARLPPSPPTAEFSSLSIGSSSTTYYFPSEGGSSQKAPLSKETNFYNADLPFRPGLCRLFQHHSIRGIRKPGGIQ